MPKSNRAMPGSPAYPDSISPWNQVLERSPRVEYTQVCAPGRVAWVGRMACITSSPWASS